MADNKKGSLAEKINFGGKNKNGFFKALSDYRMKKMRKKVKGKKNVEEITTSKESPMDIIGYPKK